MRTPVWFAEVNEKLYVFSAGDAGKKDAPASPHGMPPGHPDPHGH